MTRNLTVFLASAALLALVLCPLFIGSKLEATFLNEFVPQQEVEFAKQYIELIKTRDFATVEKKTDPQIVSAESKQLFAQMADLFPNEAPKNIKPIRAITTNQNGVTNISLSLEYEFPNQWLLANIVLQKQYDSLLVKGIHIEPLADSVENLAQFTFVGKTTIHYIVFTLAMGLLLFNIYVLALCIKTPIPKRKWLWIIFVLAGFCELSFNWATGQFYFNPLMVRIPLVQFSQGLYLPFSVMMMIPVGAIVFLYKRRGWLANNR